jgi:hypothetical protein
MAKGIEAARDIMETTGNENLVSVCLTFFLSIEAYLQVAKLKSHFSGFLQVN